MTEIRTLLADLDRREEEVRATFLDCTGYFQVADDPQLQTIIELAEVQHSASEKYLTILKQVSRSAMRPEMRLMERRPLSRGLSLTPTPSCSSAPSSSVTATSSLRSGRTRPGTTTSSSSSSSSTTPTTVTGISSGSCSKSGSSDEDLEEEMKRMQQELTDKQQQIQKLRLLCQEREDKLQAQLQEQQALQQKQAFQSMALGLLSKPHHTTREYSERRAEIRRLQTGADELRGDLTTLQSNLVLWRQSVHAQLAELKRMVVGMHEATQSSAGLAELRRYDALVRERKKLWDEIQTLKGSIRVFCRIRPSGEAHKTYSVRCGGSEGVDQLVVRHRDNKRSFECDRDQVRYFEFDRVFGPDSTQEDVFEESKPLVRSVVDGFNVCIFAYGQTGSGKTHTMQGPASDPGVNSRALMELFRFTRQRETEERVSYQIFVSIYEIYNETVFDLLSKKRVALDVRRDADGVNVVDGSLHLVRTMEDVASIMEEGHRNRSTAATDQNAHSSRSHLLFCVRVIGKNPITRQKTLGKLTLIDLAGSERLSKSRASGSVATETAHINTSLSHLATVMGALQNGERPPYRNSKLTYMLMDSLSVGKSKTLLFVHVNSLTENVLESIQSLNFGARGKSVDLGPAKRNVY